MNARIPSVICIGGAAVDRIYRVEAPLAAGTSNPVLAASRSFGGVARNVAETLARLRVPCGLVSAIGDDEAGRALAAHLETLGIATRLSVVRDRRTAEYLSVLQPTGELAFGLADMAVLEALDETLVDEAWPLLAQAKWVFADCNLPLPALHHLIERKRQAAFRLAVDAVSTAKGGRLRDALTGIDLLFANEDEARAIAGGPEPARGSRDALAQPILARGADALVMTLGAEGALVATPGDRVTTHPALPAQVEDVTGAGDALIAGTLFGLLEGAPLRDALVTGLLAASLTLEREGSVRSDLSARLLDAARERIQGATPT